MWLPLKVPKSAVATVSWDGKIKNGLRLEAGDTVRIFEENGAWYRGFTPKNRNAWGVFPASVIKVIPGNVIGVDSSNIILTDEQTNDPAMVREFSSIIIKWTKLWKTLFGKQAKSMGQNNNEGSTSHVEKFDFATAKYVRPKYNNALHKLINREMYGSTKQRQSIGSERIFSRIPSRLHYCIMDIVPKDILNNHIFMGFTQCGTYLLSFTYCRTVASFSREACYKFRLHFLLWVPGRTLKSIHNIPLFDNDSIESRVDVSIAQWKHNKNVVVAYGIGPKAECSYVSVIGVPKLGCKKCSALSIVQDADETTKRCFEHNFIMNTKFYCKSNYNKVDPVVQLAFTNQIIIFTDFIHVIEVSYVKPLENIVEECGIGMSCESSSACSCVLKSGTNNLLPKVDVSEQKCDNFLETVEDDDLSLATEDGNSDLETKVNSVKRKDFMIPTRILKTVPDNEQFLLHSGNSKCLKSFTSFFVENDDKVPSIITDSAEECHVDVQVALPLNAHGEAYKSLQPISERAWDRMRFDSDVPLPMTLKAEQRSLDIERLFHEICIRLCKINGRKFIYCFDWGCHIIDICQISGSLCGTCAMWFWANNETDEFLCEYCKYRSWDCDEHRQQFIAEGIFVWDLVSGEYKTENINLRLDLAHQGRRVADLKCARDLAQEYYAKLTRIPRVNKYRLHTTITGRSLERLVDWDNFVEITKHHSDSSESDSDSDGEAAILI